MRPSLDHRQAWRRQILARCERLKEGETLRVDGKTVRDAFPSNPFTGRRTMDALMENLPGSNYGAFTVRSVHEHDWYIVERHPLQETRVREDWDRR